MLIPIRCFSCNLPISNRYQPYLDAVEKYKKLGHKSQAYLHEVVRYDATGNVDVSALFAPENRTAEAMALDEVGVMRMCCRRHFLTHIDVILPK